MGFERVYRRSFETVELWSGFGADLTFPGQMKLIWAVLNCSLTFHIRKIFQTIYI